MPISPSGIYLDTYQDVYGFFPSPGGTVSFPASILDLQVDLNLAGTWTGISGYVYSERSKPQITRGRGDESTQCQPQTFSALLNNRDGRFSPRNPLGAYYGTIGRNTPLRVHVPEGGVYLRMEDDNLSKVVTPTSAALNVAGDLELRMDLNLTNWTATCLAKKWSNGGGNFSWALLLNADGTLGFAYSTDGSSILQINSTVPLPWPGGRFSVKVTFAHSTGFVGFFYSNAIGGTYTQLGPFLSFGAGTIFASNAQVAVGVDSASYFVTLPGFHGLFGAGAGVSWSPAAYLGPQGKIYEFQMRSVIGGTLVANPIFSAQTAGASSFADAQGNTWTLAGTAVLTSRKMRFTGEVPAWPPRWDVSGTDVYTPIQATGQLRHLQQSGQGSQPPIDSAMTRAWQRESGTYAPVAYWPCEDGNSTTSITTGVSSAGTAVPTQIASGLPGGRPMTLQGRQTSFASNTSFQCSSPLPVPNKATWTGAVPAYTLPASAPANVVRFLLSIPAAGEADQTDIARVYTKGTCAQMDLIYHAGGALQLTGTDQNGASLFDSGNVAFGQAGVPCMAEMALTVSGGTVTWHLNTLNVGAGGQLGTSGTFSGSIGVTTTVIIAPTSQTVVSGVGQIAVQSSYAGMSDPTSADALAGPLNAWAGETAGLRFARLCAEQGYAYRIIGPPGQSAVMGPQAPDTFMNLLQSCEDADNGIIFEPRQALGLAYRTLASMTNQALGFSGALPVSLSYTSAQLGGGGGMAIEPTDDDLYTVNDMTVTRGSGAYTGSSAEIAMAGAAFAASAAMSTAEPPNGVGPYQASKTINVWQDFQQVGDEAGWLVHMGTVNEPRYPSLPADLARSQLSALSNALQDLDLGDYQTVTGPPAWLPPDAIQALIWGLTETLGGFIFTIAFQTRPESPFEVLVAGTGATSDCRADTDGSTVNTGFNASATSLSIATTTQSGIPARLWTTTGGDFPFDVVIGGERMTVTSITGTSSPQTFTVTRAVNGVVKSHSAGEAVNLFQPCYLALA